MAQHVITVAGARGGHGATTVAAVLALYSARCAHTDLVATDLEGAAALLGAPMPHDTDASIQLAPGLRLIRRFDAVSEFVVIDAGTMAGDRAGRRDEGPYIAVLRGPCYLGLRSLLTHRGRAPDGIVVVREPGRSLNRRDVEEVLGVPVWAMVAQSPAVARTIDAGILVSRAHRLREFSDLNRLITRLLSGAGLGAFA